MFGRVAVIVDLPAVEQTVETGEQSHHGQRPIRYDGAQGNDGSYSGAVTGDGRYVAFASAATNLVPDDTNGVTDAFLRRMPR